MTIIIESLAALGAFFVLAASIGVYRLPTLLARLHAASKSISLGISCIILAATIANYSAINLLKGIVALAFILATIPIASHLIALTFLSEEERASQNP